MECIISHGAEKSVCVFVGDPLEFRDGEIEDVGRLGKDIRNRRRVRRRSPVGFDEKPVEGDFLDELAVVHGVIVQDSRTNGDKTIELDDFWNKPIRERESMEKE